MSAATHTSTAPDLVSLLLSYWWLALIFGGAALEFVGEVFDLGISGLKRRSKVRHKRRLELRRVDLQIAQAKAGGVPSSLRPKPGPCVHRSVRPVISADDELVGWLCACDTQLPADWAVREEDL